MCGIRCHKSSNIVCNPAACLINPSVVAERLHVHAGQWAMRGVCACSRSLCSVWVCAQSSSLLSHPPRCMISPCIMCRGTSFHLWLSRLQCAVHCMGTCSMIAHSCLPLSDRDLFQGSKVKAPYMVNIFSAMSMIHTEHLCLEL